jgi:hypothetical protein
MAENIVAGLFGLTPEMYGEQQRRSALREGIDFAKLTPGEAGAAMTYAGARGLTGAIGGALGIQDPQLKLISARQQVLGQVDQSDPTSLLNGAKTLAGMGDQQGAFALADFARKAQVQIAEQQQRLAAGQASLAAATRERFQADPEKVRLAREVALLSGPVGSIEYNTAYAKSLREQVEPKAEKDARFGTDRESVSAELYDKSFAQLTIAERAIVNKRVEEEQGKKAEKGAAKLTNVLPGQDKLADIPAFRASVQRTIEPQLKAVTAADNALENIQDSINTNNFASFRAAQTQFARAISGSGDLSQKELLAAGADPSLLGGTADYVARLFTSTPTLDTQEKIKKTLLAIKKVSTNKAKTEIEAQRKIAYSNPGYEKARVDQALDFPEFSGQNIATPSAADYAAQAKAILEQRKKVTK